MHHVYVILVDKKIIYVGRSVRPRARWRIFNKKHPELTTELSVVFTSQILAPAQVEERRLISFHRPQFNVYVASSACRVGMHNSAAHNAALSRSRKGVPLSDDQKTRLWEFRDRDAQRELNRSRVWTDESRAKARENNKVQFSDPEKRGRHRVAVQAACDKMRVEGRPMGRRKRIT